MFYEQTIGHIESDTYSILLILFRSIDPVHRKNYTHWSWRRMCRKFVQRDKFGQAIRKYVFWCEIWWERRISEKNQPKSWWNWRKLFVRCQPRLLHVFVLLNIAVFIVLEHLGTLLLQRVMCTTMIICLFFFLSVLRLTFCTNGQTSLVSFRSIFAIIIFLYMCEMLSVFFFSLLPFIARVSNSVLRFFFVVGLYRCCRNERPLYAGLPTNCKQANKCDYGFALYFGWFRIAKHTSATATATAYAVVALLMMACWISSLLLLKKILSIFGGLFSSSIYWYRCVCVWVLYTRHNIAVAIMKKRALNPLCGTKYNSNENKSEIKIPVVEDILGGIFKHQLNFVCFGHGFWWHSPRHSISY